MEIGKVPNDVLKDIILDKIRINRNEILIRPKIGEDCCAVDFGEYACVLTTGPITGAKNEIGRLAVHISCNDVASCGVEPIGLLVTLLAPPGTTREDLELIMGQLCETAGSINVDIIGGHTEITGAVNRFVVNSTAVGRIVREKLVATSGSKAGDDIVMTKAAGIEGTAIIAHDKEEELLKVFGKELVDKAKSFIDKISVVKEGVIAGEFGVNSMHDVTEGGILGAVWEVAEASGVGLVLFKEKILVEPETVKIAEVYNIDPLKLISSGCMIISCSRGEKLVKRLAEYGIKSAVIGKAVQKTDRKLFENGVGKDIPQPEADELYKVVG